MTTRFTTAISTALSALLLAGCAGSPIEVSSQSAEQLRTETWWNLCNAYAFGGHRNPRIRAELKLRDTELAGMIARGELDDGNRPRQPFSDREWQAVDVGQIFIGMSEAALICSWGLPNAFSGGDINRTVTAGGESRQYVFRGSPYASADYVYIEDGRVTAYQD